MAKRSKLYKAQLEKYDKLKLYPLAEAVKLLKELPAVKFDQTVELSFKLGVDPKQTDQTVRGAVPLPRGTGKKVTIVVIADDEKPRLEAQEAGADFVGYDDIIAKIKGGWTDFDVLIATPSAMSQVRPLGRQLGPKGLMPNPKTGTVTDKVGNAVKEAKAGRVEFRADKGACVQVPVGKLSFDADALCENALAVVKALYKAKPASAKGVYIQSFTVSATMTPGIKVDPREGSKE
ncbi:MAG: 50S ribosomal protein L1 [Lentisphaeria bacterium]|nr:50S ribosomal protein L1 [Lentisphaerota bacterium]MBO5695803.1 50S ribosomal protein L1 [Lentisphaeria bacterium]MBO5802382.1 50S ribosomal protein L1 [Lentisphaeria bacterium]